MSELKTYMVWNTETDHLFGYYDAYSENGAITMLADDVADDTVHQNEHIQAIEVVDVNDSCDPNPDWYGLEEGYIVADDGSGYGDLIATATPRQVELAEQALRDLNIEFAPVYRGSDCDAVRTSMLVFSR